MKAAVISLGSVSSKWVIRAMQAYFDEVDDINIRNIEVNLARELAVLYKGNTIKEYDCVYAKGSFRYAPLLESITSAIRGKCYMPIIPSAFTTVHNKLLTQLELQRNKIPMPTTYLASSTDSAKKILEKVNYPIIMKFPQGTQGKGVLFADSFASASSVLDALVTLKQPFLIQEYVETGGTDIRAFIVGSKVIAAMERKAVMGEKRSNIHTGGKGEGIELDAYARKIAVNTARVLGADICAVDILESIKGPLVIEANLSPGLQGITLATKVNVADKIAKYLFERTVKMAEAKKKKKTMEIMEEIENKKEILMNLDFRANRILLPEIITNITKFNEKGEVMIKANEGKLSIEKFEISKEEEK